jgi:hypothetical protein
LLGNGDGTFQGHVDYVTGSYPQQLMTADFNRDGRLDLVVANFGSNTVSVFLQSATVTLSPPSLSFGNQKLGTTSAPQTVTVTNTGSAPLANLKHQHYGHKRARFCRETNTCPSSLAGGAACSISVTFTPQAVGSRGATLDIADNASGSPQTVSLSGTGVGTPVVKLSPTSLTFATQLVGTSSASKTVTLTNTGNGTLTITGITFTGADPADFSRPTLAGRA